MKRYLRIFLIFIFCLLFFGLTKSVNANSINKISMDVYIDNSGNATITEIWNCKVTKGTEVYHPYYNLGNSSITNLTVTDNGKEYQTLSSWNTSGSLESKANKCGINRISNGVELCWGISSYGTHTYTVKYIINNFIYGLSDSSQMLYWTFIPYDFSDSIGSVYIKVHTDFNISQDVDVWGYGNYGGTAYVYDGYIEMQSSGSLSSDEYMTMLVKFPAESFNTDNMLDYDFNYYYNMAEEGATHYTKEDDESIWVIIISALVTFFPILVSIGLVGMLNGSKELNFGKEGKKIPKDIPYYRDIPCDKDVFKAYYIGYNYGLLKKKTDVMGAIILKWLKEGMITVEKTDGSGFLKKEDTSIILKNFNEDKITNPYEKQLFDMFMEASKDGILERKEFEKWCNKHYSRVLNWFDNILDDERNRLVQEGLITVEEKGNIFKSKKYIATPQLKQEAINLAGLKKFLKDYTLIEDRKEVEVALFEEYLIYAQIMGIAKEVANDFKDLYPEIIEQSQYSSYDNIIFINMYAAKGVSSAQTAQSRANSYSSGGGGFSSGGGGGGSFGGGGGGRRLPLKS